MKLWFLFGLLQVFMGVVALLTALLLRRRGQPARKPLFYGCAALAVGLVLMTIR